MIKCFKTIKDFGVYKDFEWRVYVFEEKNGNKKEYYFEKNNVIYGSNYSGKTTLSRVVKSMDTGVVSSHYEQPSFEIELEDKGKVLNLRNSTSHNYDVRVFNEDFIKENLSFLYNDNSLIKSFLVLGEENTKLENEIKDLKTKLGSMGGDDFEATGLYKELESLKDVKNSSLKAYQKSKTDKDQLFRNKATIDEDSIKRNSNFFGEEHNTIDKSKLERYVQKSTEVDRLSKEDFSKYRIFIDEEIRLTLPLIPKINYNYEILLTKLSSILKKKVEISEPIQELLNNRVLEQWVRQGRELHQDDSTQCKFCGNPIEDELWIKINKHFNKEMDVLEAELISTDREIDKAVSFIQKQMPFKFDEDKVYSEFRPKIKSLQDSTNSELKNIISLLNDLNRVFQLKVKDKHKSISFSQEDYRFESLKAVNANIELLNKIITSSNQKTTDIYNEKSKAKQLLFRHEVLTFKEKIGYDALCSNINKLHEEYQKADSNFNAKKQQIGQFIDRIEALELKRSDKSKGAEEINKILCHELGHKHLELMAIQDGSSCRYEVIRDNKTAYNLSEGEKSLIAFCYFIASLEDAKADKLNRIIWIDDPISSLDSDHVFFIYSLIKNRITSNPANYKQIFLVTHNLEFLKYCKRIFTNGKTSFFKINKDAKYSRLQKMPNYLLVYTSEFNYLFSVIYCCAREEQSDSNYHMFYNFGNSCRKFLEMYTAFKLPDGGTAGSIDKLNEVFDADIPAILVNRINNEYSHLAGSFERGIAPVNKAEITSCAKLVLKMIKDNDVKQYNSLLNSLGYDTESI